MTTRDLGDLPRAQPPKTWKQFGDLQAILTSDLNMHHITATFVTRLLTPAQKELCAKICQDLHQRTLDDPTFMSKVITGDETWVDEYDPDTKQQSSQWKSTTSPRPKARQVHSATRSMFIVFCDIRGVVHRDFVP